MRTMPCNLQTMQLLFPIVLLLGMRISAVPLPFENIEGRVVVPSYRTKGSKVDLAKNALRRDAAVKPANVLFLMCDSMDGRVLDPTSPVHEALEMPNLRRLAAEGVNFVKTYAASPQCVPSR